MHVSVNYAHGKRQLEASARAAFELRTDRKLTDAEWAAARDKLLQFVGILRIWERTEDGSGQGSEMHSG